MRISNTTAYNIAANYSQNLRSVSLDMQKLSGVAIKPSSPVSVAISERMRGQIAGVEASKKNIVTGISMSQTSDAWLQKIQDQLVGLKDLAIKANGITSPSDISNLEIEFDAIQDEITRMASGSTAAAQFNGIYLLRGGSGVQNSDGKIAEGEMSIQTGPNIDQTTSFSNPNLDATNSAVIGTVDTYEYDENHDIVSELHTDVSFSDITEIDVTSENAVGIIDEAINFISNSRAKVAAQQNELESTYSGLQSYEGNLRTSESNIRDFDQARESIEYTKHLILNSVGVGMLAQANNLPASAILKLIK